jgi:cysteine desulfurase
MPYLDYAASAPMRPAASQAMLAALADTGNAASSHQYGRRAERLVEKARAQVAALAGRSPREVVWTSGGTESDNLALLGIAGRAKGRHLIISAIEHRAVLEPARALEAAGWRVDRLPVDGDGVVIVQALDDLLQPDTVLVSVMAVNNEMGSVQPLAEIAERTKAMGCLLHVDAAQAGYLDLREISADLVTLSAHKIGGAMGVGALLVRPGTPIGPVLHGGLHERGLRPGTLNVPGIAAFGAAANALQLERASEGARVAALLERLGRLVVAGVPTARVLGRQDARAPQILAFTFPGLEGESLVTQLDLAGVATSTGAACTMLGLAPSHVLPALSLDAASIAGSLRVSLGWASTPQDIEVAATVIVRVANALLALKPMGR